MVVIGIIVLIIIAIIFGRKYLVPPPNPPVPVPDPDPHYKKWQLVNKTTERWKNYCDYMKRITSDALLAAELQKKVLVNGVWKKFYKWVSDGICSINSIIGTYQTKFGLEELVTAMDLLDLFVMRLVDL